MPRSPFSVSYGSNRLLGFGYGLNRITLADGKTNPISICADIVTLIKAKIALIVNLGVLVSVTASVLAQIVATLVAILTVSFLIVILAASLRA